MWKIKPHLAPRHASWYKKEGPLSWWWKEWCFYEKLTNKFDDATRNLMQIESNNKEKNKTKKQAERNLRRGVKYMQKCVLKYRKTDGSMDWWSLSLARSFFCWRFFDGLSLANKKNRCISALRWWIIWSLSEMWQLREEKSTNLLRRECSDLHIHVWF